MIDCPQTKNKMSPIGTKRGDFCYGLDGEMGTVDEHMTDVPINVDCDPRASCTQSTAYARCMKEFPTMAKIIVSFANVFFVNLDISNNVQAPLAISRTLRTQTLETRTFAMVL